MVKLILPPSCKDYVQVKVSSSVKILRTGLNAPLTTMSKVRIPESLRDKYTALATNHDWYSKYMIGWIEFIPNKDYERLQYKRVQKRLWENGYQELAASIEEDLRKMNY